MINLLLTRSKIQVVLSIMLSVSLLFFTAGIEAYPGAYPASGRYQRDAQRGGQQDGESDVARAAGSASLNFPPDRNDPVALQCDRLTNPVADALRIGDGVSIKAIDVSQAVPICEQAAARQPARARYLYLYGRALDAAKRYPEAAAQYAAADQGGDAWASLALGEMYEAGEGVPRDVGQAQRLYFRAGNAGFADAFSEGGELYLNENTPDYFQAKSWFERAAQGGSPDGMAHLGWMYESGNGEPKNPAKALSLFTESAKGGSVDGMYYMGSIYHEGLGVQQDLATACQWFIRAAMYENPYAAAEAGFCYYNGIGVAQDHAAAFGWFVKAGQAGLPNPRIYVADMLERGDGWNQDSGAAVQWYQAAAEQGDVYAMTELGAHLRLGKGVAWNEAAAMQWFAKAAQKGYVPAETSLAMGFENGLGQDSGQGRQDYQQAASWFEKAANQNDGYAQLNLGVMYEKGWGVPQNLERAKQLYARAAGSSNAAVAKLGSEYFSDVPASAPPNRTPQRSVASSSKDSSAFWGLVVLGALAVGVVSMLSSGGSSNTSASAGPSCCFSGSPGTSTPWHAAAVPNTKLYDSRDPTRIPMGDLTDPHLFTKTPWPDSN